MYNRTHNIEKYYNVASIYTTNITKVYNHIGSSNMRFIYIPILYGLSNDIGKVITTALSIEGNTEHLPQHKLETYKHQN